MKHTVDSLQKSIYQAYPKPMSFDPEKDLDEQRKAIREKYVELLKMPKKDFKATPVIEWEKDEDERFDEIRFVVETEPDFFVPCHMLIPKGHKKGEKLPTVICLQGHSTGMHISMGRAKFEHDSADFPGGCYALKAVEQGYIAVCMEQRGMGELKSEVVGRLCHQYTVRAFLSGRTPQGERIHDVICLVDALESFEAVDMTRLGIMGGSGGGTTSYHAMALEPRLKICMPVCSFNTYEGSILAMIHCPCNYVPDISLYMEMQDLAMLIAPRPLVIVNGAEDPIFPINTAKEAFETVKKIYAAAGASEKCRLVIGPSGHRAYPDLSWPVLNELI